MGLPRGREATFGWHCLQLWQFWKAANVPAAERAALKSERMRQCLSAHGWTGLGLVDSSTGLALWLSADPFLSWLGHLPAGPWTSSFASITEKCVLKHVPHC